MVVAVKVESIDQRPSQSRRSCPYRQHRLACCTCPLPSVLGRCPTPSFHLGSSQALSRLFEAAARWAVSHFGSSVAGTHHQGIALVMEQCEPREASNQPPRPLFSRAVWERVFFSLSPPGQTHKPNGSARGGGLQLNSTARPLQPILRVPMMALLSPPCVRRLAGGRGARSNLEAAAAGSGLDATPPEVAHRPLGLITIPFCRRPCCWGRGRIKSGRPFRQADVQT